MNEKKKRPIEWGRHISETKMGHVVSEETKAKLRLVRKGISNVNHPWYGRNSRPNCPTCGKKLSSYDAKSCKEHIDFSFRKGRIAPNKGKHYKLNLTPQERKARSERSKNQKWTQERREKMRKFMVEHPRPFKQKFKDTAIELAIEAKLKELNIPFLKQYRLHGIARVDFFLPESNIAIQCDGCFWHSCKVHYPDYHQKEFDRDRRKDLLLTEKGVKVYHFWEHEIKESPDKCLSEISL